MTERVREALTRALYRAIEIGDAAAVRRALADGADPERGPAEEFGTRPLMQYVIPAAVGRSTSRMCRKSKRPAASDRTRR